MYVHESGHLLCVLTIWLLHWAPQICTICINQMLYIMTHILILWFISNVEPLINLKYWYKEKLFWKWIFKIFLCCRVFRIRRNATAKFCMHLIVFFMIRLQFIYFKNVIIVQKFLKINLFFSWLSYSK